VKKDDKRSASMVTIPFEERLLALIPASRGL
jgi:hypothetical protein